MFISRIYLTSLLGAITIMVTGISVVYARDNHIYFAGYLGLSHFGDQDFSDSDSGTSGALKTKTAPSFAGALGIHLNDNIRLEGELSYRKMKIDGVDIARLGSFDADGDFKSWTGLLNLYYDFNTGSKFIPYLSGGIGMSRVDGTFGGVGGGPSFSEEDYGFTWQAGAGLQYRASDKTSYSFGYRYVDTTSIDIGGADIEHGGHEFRVGLQYKFD